MASSIHRSQGVLNTLENSTNKPRKLNNNSFIGRVIYADYSKGIIYYTRILTGQWNLVEGKAKLPVFNYGVGQDGKIYGKFPSVTYNTLALIVRTAGPTSTPYVVALYPDNQDGMKDIAPLSDMDDEDNIVKEVYPSGQTSNSYSNGNYLRTFNGWSFFYVWLDSADSDDGGPNFDDLLYTASGFPTMHGFYKRDGKKSYKLHGQAQKMALVHQSFSDIDTHRTAFMIGKYGDFEAYQIDHTRKAKYGLLTRADIMDGFSIKRVLDYDNCFAQTDNEDDIDSQFDASSNYSQIDIDSDNNVQLLRYDDGSAKGVLVTAEGTYIDGVLVASQTAVQQVSKELDTLQNSFDSLNNEIKGLGPDFFSKLQSDVLTLQNTLPTIQQSVNDIKSIETENTASIGTIQTNISNIQTWESGTNTSITNAQNDIKSLKTQVPDVDNRLKKVEDRLPSGSDNLVTSTQLNNSVATINNSLTGYVPQSTYDALLDRVTTLENKVAQLDSTTTTTKN